MEPHSENPGESLVESDTHLQVESSTLAGLGPRSLTPALDMLMILVSQPGDAADLAALIHRIEAQVEPPFGLIVVYEPGDDSLLAVAAEFAKTRPWLDLLPNERRGAAEALRTGFQAVGQGPVVVMSMVGSDDPGDLARMRRLYSEGHLIVAASRDMAGGQRRGGSRWAAALDRSFNRLTRRRGQFSITDPTHSFRVYDASLINDFGIESSHVEDVPLEIAAKAAARGLAIIEIPTIWTNERFRSPGVARSFHFIRQLKWCRVARRRTAATPVTAAPAAVPRSPEADSSRQD